MEKLKHIESLIDGEGEISVGRAGPVRCAAVACDRDQQLAALVRRRGESLDALLKRLDSALQRAWEHDEFIDEING